MHNSTDPTDRDDWPRHQAMIAEKLLALYRAVNPHTGEIEPSK